MNVPARSLVRQFDRTFAAVTAALLVLLIASGAVLAAMLTRVEPGLRADTEMLRQVRTLHEGMLDQETALRGWLGTGQRSVLGPYEAGSASSRAALAKIRDLAPRAPHLAPALMTLQATVDAWRSRWANVILSSGSGNAAARTPADIAQLIASGQQLFEDYRDAQAQVAADATVALDSASQQEQRALTLVCAAQVVVIVGFGVMTVRARRRVTELVARPVGELREGMDRLWHERGQYRLPPTGVAEFDALADDMNQLAAEVRAKHDSILASRQALRQLAERQHLLLTMAREAADCRTPEAAATVITDAAEKLTGQASTLWQVGDDASFSWLSGRGGDEPSAVPAPVVVRAGMQGRDLTEGAVAAFPLAVGGSVRAVLELRQRDDDADRLAAALEEATVEVLHLLTLHAATALHASAQTAGNARLAEVDPLTQLYNRRRMDQDLREVLDTPLALRTPHSLLLIDVDHFKEINDRLGHVAGDAWLSAIASTLAGSVRAQDSAYRYGGEEFAVLLAGAAPADAARMAERLRAAVARLRGPGGARVTVSIGVAGLDADTTEAATLLEAADRALYEAKARGRNAVVVAEVEPEAGTEPEVIAVPARDVTLRLA